MTHEVYDNTKISAYKKCERLYYYRHIRHWRGEGLAPPLVFGIGWHAAMDVVWPNYGKVSNRDLVGAAMGAFEKAWQEEGAPLVEDMPLDMFEKWNPRVPPIAHEMLIEYVNQRGELIGNCEVLNVEAPFVVPLFSIESQEHGKVWYAGKKDKRIKTGGRTVVIEHKSTTDYKKDGGFKSNYVEQWIMSSQVMGYFFSDNVVTGGNTDYVWVDAALVHKQVHNAFRFIPVQYKFGGMLDQWIFDTRKRVSDIRRDTAILTEMREEPDGGRGRKFIPIFSRNEESCIDRFGQKCAFFNVCTQYPNPEQIDEPPPGMKEEVWDPVAELNLEELLKEEA